MSKYKKAKKARQPNIPLASRPIPSSTTPASGGLEGLNPARASGRPEPTTVNFDYTHIKKDLTRIFTLAGLFIAALVALSFIIK